VVNAVVGFVEAAQTDVNVNVILNANSSRVKVEVALGAMDVNASAFVNWLDVGAVKLIDTGVSMNIEVDAGPGLCVEHALGEIDDGGG
jgi:hypothetical protein